MIKVGHLILIAILFIACVWMIQVFLDYDAEVDHEDLDNSSDNITSINILCVGQVLLDQRGVFDKIFDKLFKSLVL